MKILVHLHLYYRYMLAQMLAYIKNLEGYDYDLYVTMVEDDKETKNKILKFNKDTKLIVVENRGFDVAPFLTVLNKVDLDRYDYVIKLHTKRDMGKKALFLSKKCLLIGENCWRKKLLEFISTRENLKRALSLFEDPQVGMVASHALIIDQESDVNKERVLGLLKKMKLELIDAHFCLIP